MACTHHPARGQPPPAPATHPPPLPSPLLAIISSPRPRWHFQLLKPELLLCLQLKLCGGELLFGVVVARGPRGQGSGQVERGHTSVDFWAIQAARAAAAPCSSSGNTRRWHRWQAATPVKPDPKALACLKATAYSMLLPRRRATYTLLMVSHGAPGAPVGVRRTMRGACKGSKAQSGNVHFQSGHFHFHF